MWFQCVTRSWFNLVLVWQWCRIGVGLVWASWGVGRCGVGVDVL